MRAILSTLSKEDYEKDQEAENGVHEIAAHNASWDSCGGPLYL